MIDWNKRGPLMKEEVAEVTADRLLQMLSCHIKFVGILPSPNEGEVCAAAQALVGKAIPIHQFSELPLPECDLKYCGCCLMALKNDGSIP